MMLSVGGILEGAFGLVRQRYVAVAAWIGIYLALYIALMAAMAPLMGQITNPAAVADPAQMMAIAGPLYLLYFGMILVSIVLYAAAMRAVLFPQMGSFAYLRIGMDELRLLGLSILLFIAGMVISMVLVLLLGILVTGVSMGQQSPVAAGLIGLVGGLGLFALFVFLLVRVSLAFPLTLYRQKIVLGEAWRLSRGRFWTLFAAALVIAVIGLAINIAVSIMTTGGYFASLLAAAGNADAIARAAERQMMSFGQFGPMMILTALTSAVAGGLWVALSGGSIASAAKILVEDSDPDLEAIFA